jgi:hypothetical protein
MNPIDNIAGALTGNKPFVLEHHLDWDDILKLSLAVMAGGILAIIIGHSILKVMYK